MNGIENILDNINALDANDIKVLSNEIARRLDSLYDEEAGCFDEGEISISCLDADKIADYLSILGLAVDHSIKAGDIFAQSLNEHSVLYDKYYYIITSIDVATDTVKYIGIAFYHEYFNITSNKELPLSEFQKNVESGKYYRTSAAQMNEQLKRDMQVNYLFNIFK